MQMPSNNQNYLVFVATHIKLYDECKAINAELYNLLFRLITIISWITFLVVFTVHLSMLVYSR